ncbi:hypothetical protein ACFV9D_27085 [Streptomyces sp. NPDC059875]|uniref:hypothetical protein n=1 Tax=unclassified Streptomyces TaxID=2593676 RepID=UPI00365C0588
MAARSSILAGSAEILTRIRLLRRIVRAYGRQARLLGGGVASWSAHRAPVPELPHPPPVNVPDAADVADLVEKELSA